MTVDIAPSRDSNDFLKPQPKTFFPVDIPNHHPQLKHYISAIDEDILYVASINEVIAIHLPTRRRQRLATVPFEICCLGAGYGWICVGGQSTGQCAFIDVRERRPFSPQGDAARHAEVDSLLPLYLEPHSGTLAQDYISRGSGDRASSSRTAKVHKREIGNEIVNAITVHRIESQQKGYQDEEVAVLSNNDKSVQIYSLVQSRVLKSFRFSTCMNHANISPDGQLLVAVGDEARVYFYCRKESDSPAIQDESLFVKCDWESLADVWLTATIKEDPCFTTEFSESGRICAVGSQYGIITIFDTSRIRKDMEDYDAVITVINSSRPCISRSWHLLPGAVRSMKFGPTPWDLFVWAEDRGRVCVADVRDGFKTRQVLEIDVAAEDVTHAELTDLEESSHLEQNETDTDATFLRRYRDALNAQDNLAAVSHAADYMEEAAERRRRRQRGASGLDSNPHELTDTGREILESLRVEQPADTQPRDTGAEPSDRDSPERPFSIHYRNPSTSAGLVTQVNSLHQYLQERSERLSSSSSRAYPPRRRQSVVMSNSNSNNSRLSPHPSSLAPAGTSNTFTASPQPMPSTTTEDSDSQTLPSAERGATESSPSPLPMPPPLSDPWQTISAAMASTPPDQSAESPPRPRSSSNSNTSRGMLALLRENEMRETEMRRTLASNRARLREFQNIRAQFRALQGSATPGAGPSDALDDDLDLADYPAFDAWDARRERDRARATVARESAASRRERFRAQAANTEAQQTAAGTGNNGSNNTPVANGGDLEALPAYAAREIAANQHRRSRGRGANGRHGNGGGGGSTAAAAEQEDGGTPVLADNETRQMMLQQMMLYQQQRMRERLGSADAAGTAGVEDIELLRGVMGFGERRRPAAAAAVARGIVVQGVQWSGDGRKLFVGTEKGVMQYTVNMPNRMSFPALKLR